MQNQKDNEVPASPAKLSSKSKVIRDTLVFQIKLLGDGLRDVFLSPVSIAAAVAGIILYPSKPDHYLRKLMYFGHKTDRWLNLFGTYGHQTGSTQVTSDTYVKKVEEQMRKDYQEGGVVKVVKNGTESLVRTAQNEVAKSVTNKPPKT